MKKKFVRWLYKELPDLVSKGILSSDHAEKLHKHYGNISEVSGRSIALTIFSILGSLLIGSGTILLLAHNWAGLSRPIRTVLSIAPLVVSQCIGFWMIRSGKTSTAWREGVGTFLMLSIGASIALIGQTYHIPGNLGDFLFAWMLLGVPIVYILGSTLPCIMYLAGITSWAGYEQGMGGHALFFWILLALALPHVYFSAKKDPYSARSSTLGWAVALCLCVATGITLEKVLPGLWIVIYGSLFGVLYLAGHYWFGEGDARFEKPYQTVGVVGIVVLSLLLTYEFFWDEVGWGYYRNIYRYHKSAAWPDYILALMLPVAALSLLVQAVRRKESSKIVIGLMPVMATVGYMICASTRNEALGMILFNIYMFVLGLNSIVFGIKRSSLGMVNGGMFVLTGLFLARFFDVDMGFVARGVVFILIGSGFLVTNIVLAKKMKGAGE